MMNDSTVDILGWVTIAAPYLSGVFGGSVGLFLLQRLFGRRKEAAEVRKTLAEAEKIEAEADRIKVEIIEKYGTAFANFSDTIPLWAQKVQAIELDRERLKSELGDKDLAIEEARTLMNEAYDGFSQLQIAHVPPAIVDILIRKSDEAKDRIGKARDRLKDSDQ